MVDEGRLDGAGVREGLLADLLVGAPALAGDDARAGADVRLGARRVPGGRVGRGPAQGGECGGAQGRGAVGAGRAGGGRLLRVLARVDEFEVQPGGQRYGGGGRVAGAGVVRGLGVHPDLDAVGRADPERCGGAPDGARLAFGGAGVGGVLGVVRLQVLPAGPAAGGGGAGTDLGGAVEFGVHVVPDDADHGERVDVALGQPLSGGCRGEFTGGPRGGGGQGERASDCVEPGSAAGSDASAGTEPAVAGWAGVSEAAPAGAASGSARAAAQVTPMEDAMKARIQIILGTSGQLRRPVILPALDGPSAEPVYGSPEAPGPARHRHVLLRG